VLVLQVARIYEVCRCDGFKWHDIHAQFHDDRLTLSSSIEVATSTVWEAALLELMEEPEEIRR
jgi:hypothetical protein